MNNRKSYSAKWYQKNKIKLATRRKERHAQNIIEENTNRLIKRQLLKREVIDAYGSKCKCCGENNYIFLNIDHINGGGRAERRLMHPHARYTSDGLYRLLKSQNYPDKYQILCFNCNGSKHNKKLCAHERIRLGLCYHCHSKSCNNDISLCDDCNQTIRRQNRIQEIKLKSATIKAYGNKCACCAENTIDFLTIDHINNDGHIERKNNKSLGGTKFYRILKKNNWPPGYRVLCFNCNSGRSINHGVCPHHSPVIHGHE